MGKREKQITKRKCPKLIRKTSWLLFPIAVLCLFWLLAQLTLNTSPEKLPVSTGTEETTQTP